MFRQEMKTLSELWQAYDKHYLPMRCRMVGAPKEFIFEGYFTDGFRLFGRSTRALRDDVMFDESEFWELVIPRQIKTVTEVVDVIEYRPEIGVDNA